MLLISCLQPVRLPQAFRMTATCSAQQHSRGLFKYKLQIAYNGSSYQGFQVQRHLSYKDTVQGQLERVWSQLFQEDPSVTAMQVAGRTDSGVHAQGQVVSISSNRQEVDHPRLMLGMNGLLPRDIRVKDFCRVPPDFSARYSANGKLYCYELHTEPVEDPLLSHMRLHIPKPLNIFMMRSAAKAFVGDHDFTQFSTSQAKGSVVRDPHKTIQSFDLEAIPGGLRLAVYASGFLYRQVRHMVGAIVAAGLGTISAQTIVHYLAMGSAEPLSGRRKPPWSTAAAKGLRLERVDYPPHSDFTVLMHPDLPHDEHGRLVSEPVISVE